MKQPPGPEEAGLDAFPRNASGGPLQRLGQISFEQIRTLSVPRGNPKAAYTKEAGLKQEGEWPFHPQTTTQRQIELCMCKYNIYIYISR